MLCPARNYSSPSAACENPSNAAVCRAIISSSLVGITQAETLLAAVRDARPAVRRLAALVERRCRATPRPRQMRLADFGGVLADARGEDQRVEPAE